jgi:nicotinamide mononucleotide (NMN) deamidase PncC
MAVTDLRSADLQVATTVPDAVTQPTGSIAQVAQLAVDRAWSHDARLAVATTGVIGPASEERQPVGTLWIGGCSRRQPALAMRKVIDGDSPSERRDEAVLEALALVVTLLEQ